MLSLCLQLFGGLFVLSKHYRPYASILNIQKYEEKMDYIRLYEKNDGDRFQSKMQLLLQM